MSPPRTGGGATKCSSSRIATEISYTLRIPELRLKRRRNRPHSANICFSHRIECQSVGMNAMAKSTSKTSKVAKKVAGAKSAVKKAGSKEGKGGASPSQLID